MKKQYDTTLLWVSWGGSKSIDVLSRDGWSQIGPRWSHARAKSRHVFVQSPHCCELCECEDGSLRDWKLRVPHVEITSEPNWPTQPCER